MKTYLDPSTELHRALNPLMVDRCREGWPVGAVASRPVGCVLLESGVKLQELEGRVAVKNRK